MNFSKTEFKDTPIGRIPKEWEVLLLGKYIDVYSGFAFKSNDFLSDKNKGIPIVKIGNLQNGIIKIGKNTSYVSEKFYKELPDFQLHLGDVLIALSGATTGKISVVPNDIGLILVNQRVGKFKILDTSKYFEWFFYYFAQSGIFKKFVLRNIGQSAQGNLSPLLLKKVLIPLIPLPEQQKIAEILGTVDKAIQKVDEAIEKTERLKKGLMQELLTKGIGHKEFKDTEIGRIPKEWEVVRLKEAGEIITGKTPSTSHDKFWNGNISFITPGDIKDFKYLYSTERYVTLEGAKQVGKILPKDSVLTVCIGSTIGKTALTFTDSITNQQINALICKEGIEEQYVYYSLSFKENLLKLYAGVAAVPIVKKSLFERIKISLPSLMEQHKIAEILSSVDKKLETLHHQKRKYEKIKKGLMNDLLMGKRRVKV